MFVTTRAEAPLSFSVTVSGAVNAVVGVGSGVSREVTEDVAGAVSVVGVDAIGAGAGACTTGVLTVGGVVAAGVAGAAGEVTTGGVDVVGALLATGACAAAVLRALTGESSLGW